MLRIEDANTHWEQRQTPQPKARKSLLPTVGRYLYFQIWLSRIKHCQPRDIPSTKMSEAGDEAGWCLQKDCG